MRDIILCGLGHGHLHVISQAERFRALGLRLVLIDDGEFWYSSMASGLLAGQYTPADNRIDTADFAARHNVEFVKARVQGLDRDARKVVLESGETVAYDLVSFNLGSGVVPPFAIDEGVRPHVFTPKPISALTALRDQLAACKARQGPLRLLTVGGNYSGCELTCNAMKALGAPRGSITATMVTADDDVLITEPDAARRAMRKRLADWGVTVETGRRVEALREASPGQAMLDDDRTVPFDLAIVATGLFASPVMGALGLEHDDARGLAVTTAMHAPGDDRIFAIGDCADIIGHDLPKIGVFGVRAAPILTDNLIARAKGKALKDYKPQSIWFAALNCGDGTALAVWGKLVWKHRLMMMAKDWNDRVWLRKYRG